MSDESNVVQGDFSALGHAGSDAYVGLEIIELSDIMSTVAFNSDEFTALCPVTSQPDLYALTIELENTPFSIESKSLKIYLNGFRQKGCFCENLASEIHKVICASIVQFRIDHNTEHIFHDDQVTVTIHQKRRGGIEIVAVT